jgi:hypothetical protein
MVCMSFKGESVYHIIFMGEIVMKLTVDENLHPSEVQECLSVLANAYRKAQTKGTWSPDVYEEPWLGPGGEMDSIRVVRQKDAL